MNKKPKHSGIPRLSEEGKKHIIRQWKELTFPLDWQYIKIFETIEGIIFETPESCSMIYEIPKYYSKKNIPHIIHFEKKHFIWG